MHFRHKLIDRREANPHADILDLVNELRFGPARRVRQRTFDAIKGTSLFLTLLQFSWYTCGRIFAKFIHAAHEANRPDQVETLKTELQSVQFALGKMGERIPVARACF